MALYSPVFNQNHVFTTMQDLRKFLKDNGHFGNKEIEITYRNRKGGGYKSPVRKWITIKKKFVKEEKKE